MKLEVYENGRSKYFLLTSRASARIAMYLKNTFLDNFNNRFVS